MRTLALNTLTLTQAHDILQGAAAIIWNDNQLSYPSLSDLTNEDDNEFLYLSVSDSEGLEYECCFCERDNKNVRFEGPSMFLVDTDGEEVQISVLAPVDLRELSNNTYEDDDRYA